ncbi:hypothetical protein [Robiginitalea biformata]|uniref:Uncharacterized protein n=1 Tax=Robiginitalea biformata (strain ATCC BAA-864 / DSM 15991 / KCTC 12146 / HTCC2501) TaxID=313596 RepID=A4CI85_ROBBH|nr:hypothetical protein [Robiginitalea biformata]EAR16643.1 hypothetical protein RB2501_07075 [Robiginitalea biformata HTCC2501]
MELYIEKAFLDDFYASLDKRNYSLGQKALVSILTDYGEVDWFIDCPIKSPEDLERLSLDNPLFASRSNYHPPTSVESFEKHFFKHSSCEQTLIFCVEKKDWFEEAERKGALCFEFETFERTIEEIISKCHKRFDLFEEFPGWNWFEFFAHLPINSLIINDHYILSESSGHILSKNLFPLLHALLNQGKKSDVQIRIHTKDFKVRPPETEESKAERIVQKLNSIFAKSPYSFQIVTNAHATGTPFHDRYLYSNFLIVKATRGFNLVPNAKGEDTELESSSIFDHYHYRQINNRKRLHQKYLEKLKSPGFSTLSFVSFPSF